MKLAVRVVSNQVAPHIFHLKEHEAICNLWRSSNLFFPFSLCEITFNYSGIRNGIHNWCGSSWRWTDHAGSWRRGGASWKVMHPTVSSFRITKTGKAKCNNVCFPSRFERKFARVREDLAHLFTSKLFVYDVGIFCGLSHDEIETILNDNQRKINQAGAEVSPTALHFNLNSYGSIPPATRFALFLGFRLFQMVGRILNKNTGTPRQKLKGLMDAFKEAHKIGSFRESEFYLDLFAENWVSDFRNVSFERGGKFLCINSDFAAVLRKNGIQPEELDEDASATSGNSAELCSAATGNSAELLHSPGTFEVESNAQVGKMLFIF